MTTSHHLPAAGEVGSEPLDVDAVPLQLGEKDAMVDAVERLGQVKRRHRRNVAVVDALDEAIDSDEHGVLRRMFMSVET